MTSPFFLTMVPPMVGLFAAWTYVGCGGQESVSSEPDVTQTTLAQLNQHDIDTFTDLVKLSSCSFAVGSGAATFTPSNELAQVLYGDANGKAHPQSFVVPALSSGGAKIAVTRLNVEMAQTGLTLVGATAVVKLSFDGVLRVSLPVPVIGNVSTDVQINSSSLSATLVYDPRIERAQASSVTSHLAVQVKNCGTFGWCNSALNNLLNSHLVAWAELPLRDAITKGLDSADITARLDGLLVAGYNLKDHQATPWTMVTSTLNIAAGAFNFTAQRPGP